MFKSDFGIIADFFVQKRKNKKYVPSTKQIKYVDAFLKLMKALTGDKEYVQANVKGGVKTMCDVLQGAKEEGKIEGKIEGRIESLYYDSGKTPEEIAIIVNRPVSFVEDILSNSQN